MSRPLLKTLGPIFLCIISISLSAQDNPWTEADNALKQNLAARQTGMPESYRLVKLNSSLAKQLQAQAPLEGANIRAAAAAAVAFRMPLPNDGYLQSSIYESPILSRQLEKQLQQVKTYELIDAKKSSLGRLTITPDGVTGLLFTEQGTVYINPVGKEMPEVHMVYFVKDLKTTDPITCGVKTELAELTNLKTTRTNFGDCQLRTYRLAVAATGEFTAWAGSQANALVSITTTVNNINAIYERDMTMRFTLVSNNSIIYTNAATDAYPTVPFPDGATLTKNDSAIDANIGSGNYDVGIVFNRGWNGGLAQLGTPCGGSKGRAAAGLTFGQGAIATTGPQGPIFENTVAHEMAHQFGATHTMSASNGGCAGNVTAGTAFEPGGGSTIMAYAGTCSPNFYQFQSDSYFHSVSLFQMNDFIETGIGGTCPVVSASGNGMPLVQPLANEYTIPASTPFTLTAIGDDPDGNTLYYNWEQWDQNGATTSAPSPANTAGPNFRSFPYTTNPTRTFPRINDLITGAPTPYEVLPSVSRDMGFVLTARDLAPGGGCTGHYDTVVLVTVDGTSGPFVVTSQNTPTNWTADGTSTADITWDVAGTDAGLINSPAVDILLSIDGGYTYPYTLATATANDGSHTITIPNLPTSAGRVRVQSSNNIFFNINTADITITSSCGASGVTVTPGAAVSGNAGSPALDLSLSPVYGSPLTITGTIDASDNYAQLVVPYLGQTGPCITFSNLFRHDTHQFVVNAAGTYTFSRAGGTSALTMFSLYEGNINPADPCLDRMRTSGHYDDTTNPMSPTVVLTNFTANLLPGIVYTLAVGSFSATQPAQPFNYTINVAGPGSVFTGPPNPGAGFNYTYVIVNNATGEIVAIDPNSDLSDGTTFPMGQYTIYGLSYSNAISPATLNAYIGGPFTDLQNDALFDPASFCSQLSQNTVPVNILAALPAEILPLKASKAHNTVLLEWGTTFEQNTSHFEVYRSTDGANFGTHIGNISAKGYSNSPVNYAIVDQAPVSGTNYYRLKQVDLDGRSALSNVALIDMTPGSSMASLFPNPVKTTVTFEYVTPKAGQVRLVIFDSKGAVVQRVEFNAQAGRNLKTLQTAGLAKGIYAVQVTSGERTFIKRFIKE